MSLPGEMQHQDATFPHSWRAQVLTRPPLILPSRQFMFPLQVPGEEDALNRGALLIDVRPAAGGAFLATCALGFQEPSLPTGLWTCPAPDDLLGVAGGYAYCIRTADPARTEFLPLRPVCSVVPCPQHGLLLLAGFHTVLALGAEGVRWQTARLSWEGLTLGEIEGNSLHGTGWDMFLDRNVPFRVDLLTGKHKGGGYTGR